MIRKITSILLASVLLLFSLTSCIESHQLNETAIVQAIGIDRVEDQFEVTLQIYSPKGPGASTAIDTSKNNSSIISASGETLASAIRKATLSQGKKIFTGHNRIIVIGKETAEEGIEGLFSYFNRNALTRQNVQVLMAETTAKEIVTASIDQGILAAETIQKMIDNSEENGFVFLSPYYLLSKNMILNDGCGAMPMISLTSSPKDSSQSGEDSGEDSSSKQISEVTHLKMEKTAVFRDFKFSGTLDTTQTRGLLFLTDQIQKTILITEEAEIGKCSVDLYQCNTKLVPEIKDGKLSFILKVKAKAALDEILTSKASFSEKETLPALEKSCEAIIREETESAFHTAVNQYESDLLNLSDLLLKESPSLWKKIEGDFPRILSEMNLKTEVELLIDRLGMETDEKI